MEKELSRKVIVIGLDSATFDVIGPWIEDGTLPNLRKFVRGGTHGRLRSTLHPISPVAWASAVTGQSPGKHGIFDWRERNPQIYHADFVNARSLNSPTIWQLVNAGGYTAGVINVPLTYPPSPLNGYMVTGILTPNNSASLTYPPQLAAELHRVVDGYQVFFGRTFREGKEGLFIDAIHRTMEKRAQAVLYLLKTHSTDFTMVVFMESDHIQHDFWKYMDVGFPGYRPDYARYQYAIRDVFVALDQFIGQMCAIMPDDTTIFVVSDHGAGPLYKVVYIDKFLMQRGLMQLKTSPIVRFKQWGLKSGLPLKAYQMITRLGVDARMLVPKEKRNQVMNAGISHDDIDWQHTKAYSCGDFGQIAINLQGRERFGCVPLSEYEAVRNEVVAALRELRDPETGEAIVDHVYRREEIYNGPFLDLAPDILFTMQDYSYIALRALRLDRDALVETFRFDGSGNSGSHRKDGVLIAHGPHIRAGHQIENAEIIDLAPTMLYTMGLSVPDDMDGRILTDIFDEMYLSSHPVGRQGQAISSPGQASTDVYSEAEADEVRRRLKDLGYLG